MRHIFIVNPAAGKDREKKWLFDAIERAGKKLGIKTEVYVTKCEGDTTRFAGEFRDSTEKVRLYACGGDGTFNDVVNGVMGCENVSVGCVPCGTGNDFVKNFSDINDFLNIESQLSAAENPVDVIETDGKYSVNICNLGFDADVAGGMVKFKRLPGVSGSMAYSMAVVKTLISKIGLKAKLIFDDTKVMNEEIMLMVAGNGICYGGGYYGTPEAKIDDGFIDICLVRKISKLKIADLIGAYKKGLHIDNPRFNGIIEYFRCKKVEIIGEKPFNICRDGEVSQCKSATIKLLSGALNFINPSKKADKVKGKVLSTVK